MREYADPCNPDAKPMIIFEVSIEVDGLKTIPIKPLGASVRGI